MKRFLTIGLGLALMSGAIIPFSSASREAYQSYIYQRSLERVKARRLNIRPYRPFSERQGTTRQLFQFQRTKATRGEKRVRNLRFPSGSKRYLYEKTEPRISNLPLRAMSDRLGLIGRYDGYRFNSEIKGIDPAPYKFVTYENDTFSVQIPEGWYPSYSKGYFSLDADSSNFSVDIERFNNPCQNVSFVTCAITLSKDRNYKNPADKLLSVSRIRRLSSSTDKILGSSKQSWTYSETFVASSYGKNTYISRYFVEGLDGEVFLIEARSNYSAARRYIAISQKIFDSFRLYPREKR